MPVTPEGSKFIHCAYCDRKFRFQYDCLKHEKDIHADKLSK